MLVELIIFLLVGTAAGLLAGLFGIGGGAVIVPGLIFAFGYAGSVNEQWVTHVAVGCSLATIIGTSLSAVWAHNKNANIRWDILLKMIPGSVLGTLIGTILLPFIPGQYLRLVFTVFLFYTGSKYLWQASKTDQLVQYSSTPSGLVFVGAGAAVGFFAALIGVGGGVMIVPFLKYCGLNIRQAIGTSAAFTLPVAISSSLVNVVANFNVPNLPPYSTGFIYWPAVLIIMLASIPMAKVGVILGKRISVRNLTRYFGIFMLCIAVKLLI